ncbi:tetratricopeptide repeat protein [Alkalihalophilus marmarensis]|uniref:tetratricopeptide repeat protein n=1 Tax=Alkalihalophilus marmarensis TaxID=521377 RepID=UPI002E1ABA1C|nr:tetratricopeptide repeat protein [Alkalihalophilus marmarensis]
MSEFIHQWDQLYTAAHKNWHLFSAKEKEEQLHFLEEAAQSLLESWSDMEEKLIDLKQKKEGATEVPSYESRGTSFFTLEMFEQASAAFLTEEASGEANDVRLLYLGYSFLYTEAYTKAIETFLYLIQSKAPAVISHFAYVGLGCLYTQLEDFDQAIYSFEKANELTTSMDVVYNLGVCHYVKKEYSQAAHYFKETIKELEEDGEAYFFLGCCLIESGYKREAWNCFLSALCLLYTDEALLAFAKVSEWHGHHQMAIHCYKRLESLGRRTIETRHGLAWNYALIEEYEHAIELFTELNQSGNDDESIAQSVRWLIAHWPHAQSEELSTHFQLN